MTVEAGRVDLGPELYDHGGGQLSGPIKVGWGPRYNLGHWESPKDKEHA